MPMFAAFMTHYKNKYSIFLKIYFEIWKKVLSLLFINQSQLKTNNMTNYEKESLSPTMATIAIIMSIIIGLLGNQIFNAL
jgi:hypothetical protein